MKSNNQNVKDHDPSKDDIIKDIYKLGFEVGYFRHDQDAWVHRTYLKILDLAQTHNLDIDIDYYYQTAIKAGIEKRRFDVNQGLSEKSEHAENIEEKAAIEFFQSEITPAKKPVLEKSAGSIKFQAPVSKSKHTSKPKVVKKVELEDIPKLLR